MFIAAPKQLVHVGTITRTPVHGSAAKGPKSGFMEGIRMAAIAVTAMEGTSGNWDPLLTATAASTDCLQVLTREVERRGTVLSEGII
jgi:hypothetical protein